MRIIPAAFSIVLALLSISAAANTTSNIEDKLAASGESTLYFESGPKQVTLLELYTSEGCSSCPPADAWLGNLVQHPDLWRRFVPLAFHVDYWNYLGWDDVWSNPRNSKRQRRYKSEGGLASVYTPGFVANGNEWRGWFKRKRLPESDVSDAGKLMVTVTDSLLRATYAPDHERSNTLQLNVALLGFDVETRVAAGENRGKTLLHQFVVMAQEQKKARNNQWTLRIPEADQDIARTALAVWVTVPGKQKPLQSAGGWLQ